MRDSSFSDRLGAPDALALFVLAYAATFVIGALVPAGSAGLAAQQLVGLALPAALAVRARGLPLAAGLGLRRPRPAALIGATLVGLTFWWPNLWLVEKIAGAPALRAAESELSWATAPALTQLAVVVLLPALCEELLVRGAIARALGPALGAAGAIAVSSLLFAALHMPPVRMLAAGTFGIVLAAAALRTDSVVPCVWMHLVHNLTVVLILPARPDWLAALARHPIASGWAAAAACAAGAALLWRGRPETPVYGRSQTPS